MANPASFGDGEGGVEVLAPKTSAIEFLFLFFKIYFSYSIPTIYENLGKMSASINGWGGHNNFLSNIGSYDKHRSFVCKLRVSVASFLSLGL